ncbi:MAG: hypothetical protein CMJ83_14995 [Planctomycetes bacterium]|nr:hypothetical protein [Planctomycetota bacterium]
MKILTFQARRFWWKAWSQTLDDDAATTPEDAIEDSVEEAVIAFLHAETRDELDDDTRRRVFKHTLKHLKWLANKRGFEAVALHSFTHLGADNASPDFARTFIEDLAERLRSTKYEVKTTPFGWFCEWELSVYGESLAKVWKEI